MSFLKEDRKIITFIKENKHKIRGKNLKIYQNEIRDFLKLIDSSKKIVFNYNSINYDVKVKKENVPVALTIRLIKDKFILKTLTNFQYF